jgi:hypothetical protein
LDLGYPDTPHEAGSDAEETAALERALEEGPRGALAVSLIAVGLLLAGWFLVYLAVFLPRGSVG